MFKNNNKIPLTALLSFIALALAGCSPEMPERDDIADRLDAILTIGYTLLSVAETEGETRENDKIYTYRADDGVEFTVETGIGIGDYGNFAFMACDYPERWLETNHDLIANAVNGRLEHEFARNGFNLYIDGYDDLGLAAELVYAALSAAPPLPLNRASDSGEPRFWLSNLQVQIWCETHIGSFDFLYDGEEMPSLAFIETELERSFIRLIEQGRISADDNIDESVFDNYPPTSLSGLKANGEFFDQFLVYDEEYDDYLINFNSQLDFGATPDRENNYPDKGSFARLVAALGGTHETGAWTAEWTIGANTWKSETTYNPDAVLLDITGFTVYKNGEKLELSAPELGAIYRFTLADLELLTGKTITVHRSEGYAELAD